jgi:hypothetical protein
MGVEAMRRARLAAVSCACALIPLAGCGDDSSAGGQNAAELPAPTEAQADAPAVDPCLISNEEMAGILTEQFPSDEGAITVTSAGTMAPLNDGGTCIYSWIRATWSAGSDKQFDLTVFPADKLDVLAGPGERTPIDGVGDEAFEAFDNYYARVGDTVAQVVNLDTPEASVAVLTAAAGKL